MSTQRDSLYTKSTTTSTCTDIHKPTHILTLRIQAEKDKKKDLENRLFHLEDIVRKLIVVINSEDPL